MEVQVIAELMVTPFVTYSHRVSLSLRSPVRSETGKPPGKKRLNSFCESVAVTV